MANKVLHVIPGNCNFFEYVQDRAFSCGQKVILTNGANLSRKETILVASRIALLSSFGRNSLIVFHSVNNSLIYTVRLLCFFRVKYILYYWGFDFYRDIITEESYDFHCIKKSRGLYGLIAHLRPNCAKSKAPKYSVKRLSYRHGLAVFVARLFIFLRLNFTFHLITCLDKLRNYVVFSNFYGSQIVSMSFKQFRVAKYLFWLCYRRKPDTRHSLIEQYQSSNWQDLTSPSGCSPYHLTAGPSGTCSSGEVGQATYKPLLRVLICHSAASTLNHKLSLGLLERYCSIWSLQLVVGGFLSYSGGSGKDRALLRDSLESQAKEFCFATDFELDYLCSADLLARLNTYDLALFTCFRDEGVTTLRTFASLGGVLSFNFFSFNYDCFANQFNYRQGLLSHRKFLATSPDDVLFLRSMKKQIMFPSMVPYDRLNNL